MHSLLKMIARYYILALLLAVSGSALAQSGTRMKTVLNGAAGQLVTSATITVEDSAFLYPVAQSNLLLPYPVQNVVTFRVNEYSGIYLPPFTATVVVNLTYTKSDQTSYTDTRTLQVSYDSAHAFNARNSIAFSGAHRVTATIQSITTSVSGVLPALLLENEIVAHPRYVLDCSDDALTEITCTPDVNTPDELKVNWNAITGADAYDLEWTYVDASSLQNHVFGNPLDPVLLFRNNATRVTVTGNTYQVPLLYDNTGRLYFRVRAVQEPKGASRVETKWSSDYEDGLGSYDYNGHQRNLNWQAKVNFAEEGKRKVVMEYYDGTFKNRQTVSKDNTTNTAIVAETFYDYQGRPVIQAIPAPTFGNAIKYTNGFNRGLTGTEYDKDKYDYLNAPADRLTAHAAQMSSATGANNYYSPNNPEQGQGISRFIPDAGGYAFSETEYTPDNTGRISRQGGVGAGFQLGSNHEAKYFYGAPDQDELDALFGTEVGDYRHYFKNMVRDANGQYAVTYLDMHGRTIATALSGNAFEAQLDTLESNVPIHKNDTLSRQGGNLVSGLVIENTQSKLVSAETDYVFKYVLTPPVLQQADCDSNTVCYTGLYDLEIIITDDMANQRLPGGKPYVLTARNYDPENIVTGCGNTQPITLDFTLRLKEGSYQITKRLTINGEAMEAYREMFKANGICTTLEQFSEEQLVRFSGDECVPSCNACRVAVGDWNKYRNDYLVNAGLTLADSSAHLNDIRVAYEAAMSACDELCGERSPAQSKHDAMLQDMMAPTGQYADPGEAETNPYSIFYQVDEKAVPPFRNSGIVYVDETGRPDTVYDASVNAWVIPQLLTPEQFAANFKSSWAKALLPFHPEYCKLQAYEGYEASHQWDLKFEATETYQEALASGYLNPTGTGEFPFLAVPAKRDPLALQEADAIETRLRAYRNVNSGSYMSMWSVAAITAMCDATEVAELAVCAANYNTPAKAFNAATTCQNDLDAIWRSYRGLYLQAKADIIQGKVQQACAGNQYATGPQLLSAGKTPHFLTAAQAQEQSGINLDVNKPAAELQEQMNQQLRATYKATCESYIPMWRQQLAACYDSADLDVIIARMVEVCKDGSDINHPNGSSTVKPSSPYQYRSFQDVLREFTPLSPDCNSEMITGLKPYGYQTPLAERASYNKPSACECEKLNALAREYQVNKIPADSTLSRFIYRTRGISISQTDLNQLLSACSPGGGDDCKYFSRPVKIPFLMQCSIMPPCVPCRVTDSLYNRFTATFPGVLPTKADTTTAQQTKNQLFANFMNNRTGFDLRAYDYLVFRDSCQQVTTLVSGGTDICVSQPVPGRVYNSGGVDVINCVIQVDDAYGQGYLLAGSTKPAGNNNTDAYVIRTNMNGDLQWAKTYGGVKDDDFKKIAPTNDGGYIAVGKTFSYFHVKSDAFVVKLAAQGDVEWSRAIGTGSSHGDGADDVVQMSNGGYGICGMYNDTTPRRDMMVMTLTYDGHLRWQRRYGVTSSELAVSILANGDTLIVSGYGEMAPTAVVNSGLVLRLNRYNGLLYNAHKYNVGTINRNYLLGKIMMTSVGYQASLLTMPTQQSTASTAGMLNINWAGIVLSTRMFDDPVNTSSVARPGPFQLTADGGYIAVYETIGGEMYFRRMSASGSLLWTRKAALGENVKVRDLILHADGNLATGGTLGNKAFLMFASGSGTTGCGDSLLAGNVTDTLQTARLNVPMNDQYLYLGDTTTPTHGTVPEVPEGNNNAILYLNIMGYITSPTVTVLNCGAKDSCYTITNSPLLCGNTRPVFERTSTPIDNCSDKDFFVSSTATELYRAHVDSSLRKFDEDYLAACMQAVDQELFTLKYDQSEYHYTLYYYDQAGNLVKTVPPKGVVVNRSAQWLHNVKVSRAANAPLPAPHLMVTDYRYNTLNGVVAQRTPDAGDSHFWYDRLGRLSASQNSKQAGNSAYSYTQYDVLGRITEVGELTSLPVMTNAISRNATALNSWLGDAADTRREITLTTYDIPYESAEEAVYATNLRNRVSWTALYNTPGTPNTYAAASFYSYDIHGNVSSLWQAYKTGTSYNMFKQINYDYDLISGKVNQVSYQPGEKDAFHHRYIYDAENRLTNVETSRDSIYWENDAYYQYYKHGPLARSVIGQQHVQGLDYAYNLQGWLKGVNSTALTPAYDMGGDGGTNSLVARDAFGFALHYSGTGDYTPISSSVKPFADVTAAGSQFRPLYNGNVGAMSVNIPKVGEPLLYAYKYDVLERVTGMQSLRTLNSGTNTWTAQAIGDFKEAVSYDANGNILTYLRNGNYTFAGKSQDMDNLTYHYQSAMNNKLGYVTDAVDVPDYDNDIESQDPGNYEYDAIGNLTKDCKEGIKEIQWNVYGKIRSIKKKDDSIVSYLYDASGNRVRKEAGGVYTWYVRDAKGDVMSIYTENDNAINSGHLSQTETHLYGSSRLGMVTDVIDLSGADQNFEMPGDISAKTIIFTRGKKLFELSNHLGNVLATVTDRPIARSDDASTVSYYEAEVASAQDYYPFGSLMPGREYRGLNGYRYGFNGKENDNEIKGEGNQQDYGMRVYDPRIGKFLSVDPLTKSYPELTPYQFASNTPIQGIDLDGEEVKKVVTVRHFGHGLKPQVTTKEYFVGLKMLESVVEVHKYRAQNGHYYIRPTPLIDPPASKSTGNAPGKFDYSDGVAGLKKVLAVHGVEMAKVIEKMYRMETTSTRPKIYGTGPFTSKQYRDAGTGGMEAKEGKEGDHPYYGWAGKNFYDLHPEYKPIGINPMFEGPGMSGQGGNAQVTDHPKPFIVYPSVEAAMMYKADYISRYEGDWARWGASKEPYHTNYKKSIEAMSNRIVDSLLKEQPNSDTK